MARRLKSKEKISWFRALLYAIGIAFLVRTFLITPYTVSGASMNPTLENGERLFINKLAASLGDIKHGDIVIIKNKEQAKKRHYVKRVIGLPGDTIEMKRDRLYINGKMIQEPYLNHNLKQAQEYDMLLTNDFGPMEVPEHFFFVMGDNRLISKDSRNGLGLISEKRIIGTSEFVIYPLKKMRHTH